MAQHMAQQNAEGSRDLSTLVDAVVDTQLALYFHLAQLIGIRLHPHISDAPRQSSGRPPA